MCILTLSYHFGVCRFLLIIVCYSLSAIKTLDSATLLCYFVLCKLVFYCILRYLHLLMNIFFVSKSVDILIIFTGGKTRQKHIIFVEIKLP